MWHMEAYRSSLSSGVTNTFQQVTAITAGAVLAPSGSGFQVATQLPFLHSLFGVGAHIENIQPQAASFQPLPYPTFQANNVGTAANNPPAFWDLSANPKALRPTEFINMYASQINAGAENEAVFVNFTDNNPLPAPAVASGPSINGNGQFTIAHGTGTTTLTANAWTQVTITLDTALPAGYYALVGCRAVSAGCLAFRIRPIVEPLWRPGGVGTQAATDQDPPNQRFFNPLTGRISPWGVWVYFFQNTFPYVEFWSTSADTVENVYFDLIKISDVVTANTL
jgi:hypothetical protein